MIVLNKERELIEITNTQDILEIPGYVPELVRDKHTLKDVIAVYLFNDKIPCGLKDCRQKHNRGYIVSTEEGSTGNIGNICGKSIFGLDFDTKVKTFKRDLKEKKSRDFLISFNIIEAENKINDLLDRHDGARWAYAMIKILLNPTKIPANIVNRLRDMKRTGSPVVSVAREATSKEKERDKSLEKTVQNYVTEQIGVINGLQALYEENDLANLLTKNGLEVIKELRQTDILSLSNKELAALHKKVSDIESNYKKAVESLMYHQSFLTKPNLSILKVFADKKERKNFEVFIGSLPH